MSAPSEYDPAPSSFLAERCIVRVRMLRPMVIVEGRRKACQLVVRGGVARGQR